MHVYTSTGPAGVGSIPVGNIMQAHPPTVTPSATVDEALEILVENRVSGLMVLDDKNRVIGTVSDLDLICVDSLVNSDRSSWGCVGSFQCTSLEITSKRVVR